MWVELNHVLIDLNEAGWDTVRRGSIEPFTNPHSNHAAYIACFERAKEINLPSRYACDLICTDRESIERHDTNEQFAIIFHETGTLLNWIKDFGAIESFRSHIQYDKLAPNHIYLWNGETLKHSNQEEVEALMLANEPEVFMERSYKSVEMNVVSSSMLTYSIPFVLRELISQQDNRTYDYSDKIWYKLNQLYQSEISYMVDIASNPKVKEPRITFTSFDMWNRESGKAFATGEINHTQLIADFNCSDMARDYETGKVNLHLQNTSSWAYAGAICLDFHRNEGGKVSISVSSHH